MNSEQSSDSKLEQITEILWKFFWFSFYVILLPIVVSVLFSFLFSFLINGNFIWVDELNIPSFYLLLAPLILVLQIPYDRNRDKKLFTKSEFSGLKQLAIYFFFSLFPLAYSFSLGLFFTSISTLFLQIIHPICSLIGIIYYNFMLKKPQSNWTLKKIKNRRIETSLFLFSFIIRSIFVVLFIQSNVFLLLLIMDITSAALSFFFYYFFVLKTSDSIHGQPINNIINGDGFNSDNTVTLNKFSNILPREIKSNLFFILFPVIHLILLGTGLLWNMGLLITDVPTMIILPFYSIGLILIGIYYIFHFQLKHTEYLKILVNSSKIKQINAIALIDLLVCNFCVNLIDIQNIFNSISIAISLSLNLILLIVAYVEMKKELISETFASYFITFSTLILISFVTVIIPVPLIYQVTISSILTYVSFGFLGAKQIVPKSITAVIQAILLPAIIFEIFFSASNLFILAFITQFIEANQLLLFQIEAYSTAVIISSIISLISTYYARLQSRTSSLIKGILLVLQILLIGLILGLVSLFGNIYNPFYSGYNLFYYFLLPLVILIIITLGLFRVYYYLRIYSNKEYIRMNLYGIDILSGLIGLTIINFVPLGSSFIICSLLVTFSFLIHIYIEYREGFIKNQEKYNRISNFLTFLLFTETAISIFLLLFQNIDLAFDLSAFITSVVMMLILWKIPVGKIFTLKFSQIFNLINILIQLVFVSSFFHSLTTDILGAPSSFFHGILINLPPIIIGLCYLIVFFLYGIKNGLLFRKWVINFSNLLFFSFYVSLSLIPSYVIQLLINNNSFNLVSNEFSLVLIHILFTSTLVLSFYFIDFHTIKGMYYGPKNWIISAIESNKINILSDNQQSEKNKLIILNSLNVPNFEMIGSKEEKITFQRTKVTTVLHYFAWIISLISTISIFLLSFFGGVLPSLEYSFSLFLSFSSIFLISLLRNMKNVALIKDSLQKKVRIYAILYLLFAVAFDIFVLVRNVSLILRMDFILSFILALDIALIFVYGIFKSFKSRIVKYNQKLYYSINFGNWLILSFLTAGLIGFSLKEIIIYADPAVESLIGSIFSLTSPLSVVFFIFSVIFIGFLISIHSINFLKEYNRFLLESADVDNDFDEQSQHAEFMEQTNRMVVKGISDSKTEILLKEKYDIFQTYRVQRFVFLTIYYIIPAILFLVLIQFPLWNPDFDLIFLTFESIVLYFGSLFLIFCLENRFFKKLELKTSWKIIFIVWIFCQFLISINISLIESSLLGQILLFLLNFSILLQLTHYLMDKSNITNDKLKKIRDPLTQIIISVTSTAYLVLKSVSAIVSSNNSNSYDLSEIYRYTPILIVFINISFYWSYITKYPKQPRFFRTFIFSYPFLLCSIILLNLNYWYIDFISATFVLIPLIYYYSMISKRNAIVSAFYQLLIMFIGFIFITNALVEPWILILGVNSSEIQRNTLSLSLILILYYYIKKAAYFEIYRGYMEETVQNKEIGIIGGLGRSIGLFLLPELVFTLLEKYSIFYITKYVSGGLFTQFELFAAKVSFNIGIQLFIGLLSLSFFIKHYLSNHDIISYKIRYIVTIATILSFSMSIAVIAYLYSVFYTFVIPIILIGYYFILTKFQKNHPYQANNIIGISKTLITLLFTYWALDRFIIDLIYLGIRNINPLAGEVFLLYRNLTVLSFSVGIAGFIFSKTMGYVNYKIRKLVLSLDLIISIISFSLGFYFIISLILPFDNGLPIFITLDLSTVLVFISVGLYNQKFSKEIWAASWWIWIFIPVVNFSLIWRGLSVLDIIMVDKFSFFNLFELNGSFILTVIIASVLFFPVILFRVKKFYKYAFLTVWLESIPLWIWLSQNLFSMFPYSMILNPLFIIGLALISLLPLLYQLKLWKIVAPIWMLITVSNGIFISILIENTIMDISINLILYGAFLMILFINPEIKNKWKRYSFGILFGYVLMLAGITLIFYSVFYLIFINLGDPFIPINLTGISLGIIMFSGKALKSIKNHINKPIALLLAINTGFLLYRIFYLLGLFPLSLSFESTIMLLISELNLFALSFGITCTCGILLVAQARSYLWAKYWRITYFFMALSVGLIISTLLQSLTGFSLNFYIGTLILFSTLVSYPSLKNRTIFWMILPVSLSFFVQEILYIPISRLNMTSIAGNSILFFCLWLLSYGFILGITLLGASFLYKSIKEKSENLLRTLGILIENLDFIENMPETREIILEKLSIHEEIKGAQKALKSIEKIPMIFKKERILHYINSAIFFSILYLFAITFTQLILNPITSWDILLFSFAISNFMVLKFNKNHFILQNPTLVRLVSEISGGILYFSLGLGFSLLFLYLIDLSGFLYITLNISIISLIFYIIFVGFEYKLNIFREDLKIILKSIFWVVSSIAMGIFIFDLFQNIFLLFIILTLSGFNLKRYLDKLHHFYSKSIELIVNIDVNQQENINEISSEIIGDLESEVSTSVEPKLHDIDVSGITESINEIFEEPTDSKPNELSQSDKKVEEIFQEPQIQEDISESLTQLKLKQIRLKRFKKSISIFDIILRQVFIIEIAYLIALITILIIKVPFDIILLFFVITLVLTLIYNYTTIIPDEIRSIISILILFGFLILTEVLAVSIYYTYIINLLYTQLEIYIPILIFLITSTIFINSLQTLLIIKNFVSKQNIHIQKSINERAAAFIHPIILIDIAFIIANFLNFRFSIITSLTFASVILFGEVIADHYLMKWFNRFSRSRFLLISWILVIFFSLTQLVIIIPNNAFYLSLTILTLITFVVMQLVTVLLLYNTKREKILLEEALIRDILPNLPGDVELKSESTEGRNPPAAIQENNELPIESVARFADTFNFTEYKKNKYSIIGLVLYILLGLLLSAIIYERVISDIFFSGTNIDILLYLSLLIFIAIIIPLILSYLDRFKIKLLKPTTRILTILIFWIMFSVILIPFAYLSPLIIICISIFQYYTMYLLSNLMILYSKNQEYKELFIQERDKLSEETQKEAEVLLGYEVDWENLYTSDSNIKRQYLLGILKSSEPKKTKFIKNINSVLGFAIYLLISVSVTVQTWNLIENGIIAILIGSIILYAQSELNFFKIKSFSSKFNFRLSVLSWMLFTISISIIPLTLWNLSLAHRLFFISLSFIILNLCMFWTLIILKRGLLQEYDVKMHLFKYFRISLYLLIVFSVFSLILIADLVTSILIASIILYLEMIFESYRPILLSKTVSIIKFIAGLSIAVDASVWIFQSIGIFLNFNLGIISAFLVFSILFLLIYNPFRKRKWQAILYWMILSVEMGFFVRNLTLNQSPIVGIISGSVFMIMYVFIFEFRRLIEFLDNLVKYIKYFIASIMRSIKMVIEKIRSFIVDHKDVIIFIGVVILDIILSLATWSLPMNAIQTISISTAISSVFLYPIFSAKDQSKSQKTFSRMVYYSLMVYILFTIVLYSFVVAFISSFTELLIWLLLSIIFFSSILLVVIYRREKIYNLSIKWRFSLLVITILMVIALCVDLVIFFL